MSVESVIRDEAERAEYVRVVSKRIGELAAAYVDPQTLINATDEDLRSLAATLVVMILNELGEEALEYATTTSEALGFDVPKGAQDFALERATETTVNRLYSELEEQRARFQKAAAGAEGISAGLALGILAALSGIFSDAAQAVATDLPVELNRALAQARATLGGAGEAAAAAETAAAADAGAAAVVDFAAPEASLLEDLFGALTGGGGGEEPSLRWITRHDDRVCDEDGPEVETPSGVILPPGAGTSCLTRHGVILPASDWIAEGLPRDPRLLCSRYKRPRCRCLVASAKVDAPKDPVNIAPDVARGKERGMAEEIDLQPAHLDAAFRAVSKELDPLVDPDLFELKIRVKKRTPAPVPVPVKAGR